VVISVIASEALAVSGPTQDAARHPKAWLPPEPAKHKKQKKKKKKKLRGVVAQVGLAVTEIFVKRNRSRPPRGSRDFFIF